MILARYPSDLTDSQWAFLAPLIPPARAGGRPSMVGNTGRKCSSQGMNVIGGGSQCMGNLYKALLSHKSRKFDLQIQQIVPKSAIEHNMWGLVVSKAVLILSALASYWAFCFENNTWNLIPRRVLELQYHRR